MDFNTDIVESKTLRLIWDTITTIPAAIASIYDPLGLLGSLSLKAKLIIQRLWSWNEDLQTIKHLEISRNITSGLSEIFEFHCFSEASECCYESAIYLSTRKPNGPFYVIFVVF